MALVARRQSAVGIETLIGAESIVDDDGWVRVQGELWRQRGGAELKRVPHPRGGGLTLVVEPIGS